MEHRRGGQADRGHNLPVLRPPRPSCFQRLRVFMDSYPFLLLPVVQVPPFDVTEPWVREIEGVVMPSYIDWMKSCYYVSVTGHPAISVPAGFTPEGLPVGLQIVGRHQDDLGVLQLAYAFEQATGPRRWPELLSEARPEPLKFACEGQGVRHRSFQAVNGSQAGTLVQEIVEWPRPGRSPSLTPEVKSWSRDAGKRTAGSGCSVVDVAWSRTCWPTGSS